MKGRRRLQIRLRKGGFKWDPPTVVDRASKQKVNEVLDAVAQACETAGMPVTAQAG